MVCAVLLTNLATFCSVAGLLREVVVGAMFTLLFAICVHCSLNKGLDKIWSWYPKWFVGTLHSCFHTLLLLLLHILHLLHLLHQLLS